MQFVTGLEGWEAGGALVTKRRRETKQFRIKYNNKVFDALDMKIL